MKRCILVLFLLLPAFAGKAQTNIYHPFPTSNAFWEIDGSNCLYPSVCNDTRYGIVGDTLIGGLNYIQIYSLYDSTLTNPNSHYYAAIREENKRVYTRIGSNPETLLYDFNLEVGDTIWHTFSETFFTTDSFFQHVLTVDSMLLLDGKYRKRWVFESATTPDDIVIEGIGSISGIGLFNPIKNAWATNGDQYQFACFKHNDTALYINNPECENCFCSMLTSIDKPKNVFQCKITPNPVSGKIQLCFNNEVNNVEILIYNTSGQLIYTCNNVSGKTTSLDMSNFKSGLYLLQVSENQIILFSDKIIVEH